MVRLICEIVVVVKRRMQGGEKERWRSGGKTVIRREKGRER